MSWNYVISSNATHMPTKRARSADVAVVVVLPVVVAVVVVVTVVVAVAVAFVRVAFVREFYLSLLCYRC